MFAWTLHVLSAIVMSQDVNIWELLSQISHSIFPEWRYYYSLEIILCVHIYCSKEIAVKVWYWMLSSTCRLVWESISQPRSTGCMTHLLLVICFLLLLPHHRNTEEKTKWYIWLFQESWRLELRCCILCDKYFST